MKKKVIFRSGSLRMGGLERVLIEVLQTIDREKFDIYLVIDDDCGEENIFEKDRVESEVLYENQKLNVKKSVFVFDDILHDCSSSIISLFLLDFFSGYNFMPAWKN